MSGSSDDSSRASSVESAKARKYRKRERSEDQSKNKKKMGCFTCKERDGDLFKCAVCKLKYHEACGGPKIGSDCQVCQLCREENPGAYSSDENDADTICSVDTRDETISQMYELIVKMNQTTEEIKSEMKILVKSLGEKKLV